MYNNHRILALIPARGGSKGIKDKNIYPLCGMPLIGYTIKAAQASQYVDEIIITTDNDKIAEVAQSYGLSVPFLRPAELASDNSKTIDAVLHAIKILENMGKQYHTLLLLQPTQPLRSPEDIDNAIALYFENHCEPLVSVSPVTENPILVRTIIDNQLHPLLYGNSTIRRQDMQTFYKVNGCIYLNKICEISTNSSFNDNTFPFLMKSSHSIDIDDFVDIAVAEYYLKQSLDE